VIFDRNPLVPQRIFTWELRWGKFGHKEVKWPGADRRDQLFDFLPREGQGSNWYFIYWVSKGSLSKEEFQKYRLRRPIATPESKSLTTEDIRNYIEAPMIEIGLTIYYELRVSS
jgi:hypothetical protein